MLATLDWIIIIGFLTLIVAFGLSFTQKAGKNLESFFLGNRNLPWYIAGISMVATTFAADTPLAVTELVGQSGISGNWLWWNMLAGGMLTTFFFANLWRRSGVLTEVELIEMRYHGKPAAFLRGFKSLYLGIFMNVMIIGWVNLALATLLEVFFDISATQALMFTGLAMILVAVYSSLSGLLGVAFTDVIQFFVAMTGCIILAILVMQAPEIGGISGLKEQLPAGSLNFFPSIGGEAGGGSTLAVGVGAFFAYIGIQWWASWYPGAEPGGGGYVAQRMMSAKNEKHAVYATLFFQVAHYCIRPWPWILVGLAAVVLFKFDASLIDVQQFEMRQSVTHLLQDPDISPKTLTLSAEDLVNAAEKNKGIKANLAELNDLNPKLKAYAKTDAKFSQAYQYAADTRKGYVFAMTDFLPTGLKGLLLVAFFAAYMSTISTQLNWGASYVVNDFYHRFVDRSANDKRLVMVARLTTILLMILGLVMTMLISSISGAWTFIIECGAGLGLVLILRWYWWRINAWSEIVATIAPFFVFAITKSMGMAFPQSFYITVGFTTVAWIVATYLTAPTDAKHLQKFYKKVRPSGAWTPIREAANTTDTPTPIGGLFLCWLSAVALTYSILFASGKLIFMEWQAALIWLGVGIVSFILLQIGLAKTKILQD